MSESMFIQAVSLARSGRKIEARRLLEQLLRADRTNEMAWLWYAECVDTPGERAQALEACVRMNPQAQRVRLSLSALQNTGTLAADPGLTLPVFVGDEKEDRPPKPARSLSAADQWVLSPESNVFTVSPEQITDEEFSRVQNRTETFLLKNPDLKPIWTTEKEGDVEPKGLKQAPYVGPFIQDTAEEPKKPSSKPQRKSRGAIFTLLLVSLMVILLISAAIMLRVV